MFFYTESQIWEKLGWLDSFPLKEFLVQSSPAVTLPPNYNTFVATLF